MYSRNVICIISSWGQKERFAICIHCLFYYFAVSFPNNLFQWNGVNLAKYHGSEEGKDKLNRKWNRLVINQEQVVVPEDRRLEIGSRSLPTGPPRWIESLSCHCYFQSHLLGFLVTYLHTGHNQGTIRPLFPYQFYLLINLATIRLPFPNWRSRIK